MTARVDVVIAQPRAAEAPPAVVPTEEWTHAQLDEFAADRGIELAASLTKPEKLAALAAVS